jgi:hypothetical protein
LILSQFLTDKTTLQRGHGLQHIPIGKWLLSLSRAFLTFLNSDERTPDGLLLPLAGRGGGGGCRLFSLVAFSDFK